MAKISKGSQEDLGDLEDLNDFEISMRSYYKNSKISWKDIKNLKKISKDPLKVGKILDLNKNPTQHKRRKTFKRF